MKKPSIVQLNNHYIKKENLKKKIEEEESQKKKSFYGMDPCKYDVFIYFANL
ncbi:septum formation initiator family protein [Streptococcus pyogenes]|nr:septum formation initiator family protein [Streptococcus pyogenes]